MKAALTLTCAQSPSLAPKMIATVSQAGKVPYGYPVTGIRVFARNGDGTFVRKEYLHLDDVMSLPPFEFDLPKGARTVACVTREDLNTGRRPPKPDEKVFFLDEGHPDMVLYLREDLLELEPARYCKVSCYSDTPDGIPVLRPDACVFQFKSARRSRLLDVDFMRLDASFADEQREIIDRYGRILDEARVARTVKEAKALLAHAAVALDALSAAANHWRDMTAEDYVKQKEDG